MSFHNLLYHVFFWLCIAFTLTSASMFFLVEAVHPPDWQEQRLEAMAFVVSFGFAAYVLYYLEPPA